MNKSILIVLLFCLIMMGCKSQVDSETEMGSTTTQLNSAVEVQVVTAEIQPFTYHILAKGTIESRESVEVRARTGGYISKVMGHNGMLILKGKVLIEMENAGEELALEKAIVELQIQELEYQSQLLGLNKEKLSDSSATADNIKLLSGLASVELNVKEAKQNLENTIVRPGLGGVIADLDLAPGNQINAGDLICRVYNPRRLKVAAEVLETQLGSISIGLSALVTITSNGSQVKAIVSEINPRIEKSGMVKIDLDILEPKGLLPGMHVTSEIQIPQNRSIVIPKQALVLRSGKEVVFAEEDGLAKWKYVTSGLDNGKQIEILDGLIQGDRVIITNNLQLAHDAPVLVIGTEVSGN